jgi:hypothetical protein
MARDNRGSIGLATWTTAAGYRLPAFWTTFGTALKFVDDWLD